MAIWQPRESTDLLDMPDTVPPGQILRGKDDGSGYEPAPSTAVPTKFEDLANTPALTGNAGKVLRVNAGETDMEFAKMDNDYVQVEQTHYLWFAVNNTSGTAVDGVTPIATVRLAGDTANASPIISVTPTLLSDASFPDGCYEIAIPVTAANGFLPGKKYGVFATIAADAQNPAGIIGKFST